MEWVETTARTVGEAKELALDRLGVDEEDAEFDVLEEPKPGLFGRIRGEARVRARVRPTRPRPKVERRERRRRTNGATTKETSVSTTGPEPTSEQDAGRVDDDDGAKVGRTTAEAVQAQGAAASTFLVGLAEAFGLDGHTDLEQVADNEVEVRLHGDDLGLLIGPRGQTLQAVLELTRLAVQRHDDDRQARLRIDIAGYRERRRQALGRFTEQVASQVVATGEPKALEPMSAPDRKVVHDVANSLAGVTTRSEGEDPFRRVVIVPSDG